MGYSYGRTSSGRSALACDHCGGTGGTRKRPCRFKVIGYDTPGGQGYSLPYCPAPALCSPCFANLGGSKGIHGPKCEQGAQASQATNDAVRDRLLAGDAKVGAAWGAWHDLVPEGQVGVLFVNMAGTRSWYLVPADQYGHGRAGAFLSDFTGAQVWSPHA